MTVNLKQFFLIALAVLSVATALPTTAQALWAPHPQYDTLMIHVNGNAGVPVLTDTAMTILWSFPNQIITGIEYFVTGPTPAGTQNTPGLIQSTLAVGSVVISARDLIGNPNIGVGEYTLFLRKKGIGNNYLSLPFKVVPENPQIPTVTPGQPANPIPGTPPTLAQLLVQIQNLSLIVQQLQAQLAAMQGGGGGGAGQPPVGTNLPSNMTSEGIRTITATRNYKTNQTIVQITYSNSPARRLVLSVVEPQSAVVAEIARQLGFSVADISRKVVYGSVNGKEIKKIILIVTLATRMDLDITLYDGTKQFRPITESDINEFVDYSYNGDFARYRTDFDLYIDRARRGLPIDRVYELVANALGGMSKAEVREKLEFDVEAYQPNGDPATGG